MNSIRASMIVFLFLAISNPGLATEMPALARKNGCTDCHSIDRKIVGPAWKDVSMKYKGASEYEYRGEKYPLVEGLVMKVSKGGSGNWGAMPMPMNDPSGAKRDDIRELVQFVLMLTKQQISTIDLRQ